MTRILRFAAFAGLLLLATTPARLAAQALCSAPHSSPTLGQSGALRTLPAGAGWAQISAYAQKSTRFFGPAGDIRPFLAETEFTTRSVFLTGAIGLLPGLELWAQIPAHRLRSAALSGGSESRGVGDVRVAARLGPEVVGLELPVALRAGVKLPGSDFAVDATVLPLTEGQRDVEISLESGTSLPGLPVYLAGWVGWRWRGTNVEASRTPGDEGFAHLALGSRLGPVHLELAGEVLRGRAPVAQRLRLEGERRRMLMLIPTLGWDIGPGSIDLTAQIPMAGRNLPAGTGIGLGYRTTWGLR